MAALSTWPVPTRLEEDVRGDPGRGRTGEGTEGKTGGGGSQVPGVDVCWMVLAWVVE